MKISKIFAIASAAVLMVACGSSKVEGSKEVRDLLPKQSQVDSVSYLLGVNFGSVIKGNNFGDLNLSQLMRGMKDFLKAEGEPRDSSFVEQFRIDPTTMNVVINDFLQKRHAYEGALNEEKGKDYIEEFLKQEGAEQTESGLAYLIIEPGSDKKVVSDQDTVWVNYKGTLLDGTTFDENENISFPLNRVISGWTEGMKLVGEGGKIKLVIPGDLAYGNNGPGGANSTLLFDVDVLKVGTYVEPEPEPAAPAAPARRR